MDDPPTQQKTADIAYRSNVINLVFSSALASWVSLAVAAWRHRRLRTHWTAENAAVWVAANTEGMGTLTVQEKPLASSFIPQETRNDTN